MAVDTHSKLDQPSEHDAPASQRYLLAWTVALASTDPVEAAASALHLLREADSPATHFLVIPWDDPEAARIVQYLDANERLWVIDAEHQRIVRDPHVHC